MKQMLIVVAMVVGAAVLTWIIITGDEGGQKVGEGGLKIADVKVGTGREAQAGDMVAVHYTGTLADGKKFDSSRDRGEPIVFRLGVGEVIPGWDQGIAGMREGGKRKLIIPPNLAYGAKAAGKIPPNSELHFDVELVKVQ